MATPARPQRVDIHELQREMMASDLRAERAQTSAALAGKTGARRREGFGGRAGGRRPGRDLDVHELLKQEAFATAAGSCDDHFEKSRPCPSAVYGVSDQYMVLDSFEKVQDSRPELGQYKFNFMVQGVTRDQSIGVKDRLDTIIGIQVSDFCIPLLPFDSFDPAEILLLHPGLPAGLLVANGALPAAGSDVSNVQSQLPFCGRVTMFLKEIGLQSYSDADNRRHHFEFDASVAGPGGPPAAAGGDRILLTPLDDCGYFLFTDPIQDVHGLTVCFYNPGNELRFPPDVIYGAAAAADGAGLLTFSYTDPTNLTNLAVDDRIFIVGFASGHGVLDAYVNRPEGHLVGAGGFSDPGPTSSTSGSAVSFRLNPDVVVTALTPPLPAGAAIPSATRTDVRIAKNRLRIPLRFRRVVARLTNYIAP